MLSKSTLRIALALVASASMWFYVQHILIPYQPRETMESHGRPGNYSDLYPRWLGARELLLNGRDPYSSEITREIQVGYYGRPLDPSRPNEPTDEQAFAYPVFVVFLLSPTIVLPFSNVQGVFLGLLLAVTVATVPLWMHFLQSRTSKSAMAVAILLTVGSLPVIQGLMLQQLSLLVAGLVALASTLLVRGRLVLPGVLMALTMAKPQLTVPVAGWFLLWALSNWRDRNRYVLSFGLTLGVLLAGSEWILPGWMSRFMGAISSYQEYAGNKSLLDGLLGDTAGRAVAGLIVLVVLFVCWKARSVPTNSPQFAWVVCTVLAATAVIIPRVSPYNHVLLLPAILEGVRRWRQLTDNRPVAHRVALVCGAVILLPWLTTSILMLLWPWTAATQAQQWWQLPFYPVLLAPLAVLALQGISWRRMSERHVSES